MILKRNYFLLISLLALFTILLNLNNISIYGQQSNAPFVTKNELKTALDNVVTQDELQATEDELQSSLAQLQLRQDQLQAALDNVVTQDELQATEDELQSSLAQLQARQNQLQTSLAAIQSQLQDTLANVVTQDDLNEELGNLLVTVQQLIENQEPIIPECPTFIQLPGGQIFAELKRDSSTRMIVGGPVDNQASGNIGPVNDVCIVPPNAFQQNLP
jgi:predicted  nucleic acid-binding Zn-ribbon protein